jgi:TBC1 domain family member 2
LPSNLDRHDTILQRKRREYREIVLKYFTEEALQYNNENGGDLAGFVAKTRSVAVSPIDPVLHQISIDIPRTCPESKLFRDYLVQCSLLKILYCWSIRRPATGYVQGINDLVTPLYSVFLNRENDLQSVEAQTFFEVEADTFWCLSGLLDTIQDSYTFNQSGIYRQITLVREIALRMDPQLVRHLESEGVQFVQFAFRWMNCLLLREFRLKTIQRLWDSYLSDGADGFKTFHPYVCAAFLLKWRKELQNLDFQDMVVFLQNPPTESWNDRDVEMLVAEAFVLKSLFCK